jgi:hypothetical protein
MDSIRDFTNEQGKLSKAQTPDDVENGMEWASHLDILRSGHTCDLQNQSLAQHATQTGDVTPKTLSGFKAQTLVV